MPARRPTRLALIAAAMSSFAAVVALLGGATTTAAYRANVTSASTSRSGSRPAWLPPGWIVFRVLNRGNLRHDFEVGGTTTRVLAHGQRQLLPVELTRAGAYRFRSALPGQAQLGMTGVLEVAERSPDAGTIAVSTRSRITLTPVLSGLPPLTFATSPPGDTHRVGMVVEQDGLVLLLKDGQLATQPFADLRSVRHGQRRAGAAVDRVCARLRDERAPTPTTTTATATSESSSSTVRGRTNPDVIDTSRRRILAITKTTADHNGGMMQFGSDGVSLHRDRRRRRRARRRSRSGDRPDARRPVRKHHSHRPEVRGARTRSRPATRSQPTRASGRRSSRTGSATRGGSGSTPLRTRC